MVKRKKMYFRVTAVLGLTVGLLAACNDNNNYDDYVDDPGMSIVDPNAPFQDSAQISNYARKAVNELKELGLLPNESFFYPKEKADFTFAEELLNTSGLGDGLVTYAEAERIIREQFIEETDSETISIQGFLTKKYTSDLEHISREDFVYMLFQAKNVDFVLTGSPIHNPAIAAPGPLLGPTVHNFSSSTEDQEFDGSTISLFHRGKNSLNTTFTKYPTFTLQVHPEVFKSVSQGGIDVDSIQELSAQLEVELTDGSIHRTPLTSMEPFSIHGADGKKQQIRIEDGILILVEDLLGNTDEFELNGRAINVQELIGMIQTQSYYNGETTNSEITSLVVNELNEKGFTLQDRRIMLHNLILAKTALQQSGLSPLSAPFNTIAGPSSSSRGFREGSLFSTYKLVESMLEISEGSATSDLTRELQIRENQQNFLTSTKVLTAATLLPHISSLANAPFLPNEALSSRVKKSGALLPSEPIVFQFDRLKRASYIILDEALSGGTAEHLVTNGELIREENASDSAFSLKADNFTAVPIEVKDSVLVDALWDFKYAYEELVEIITGVELSGALGTLSIVDLETVEAKFSSKIMSDKMSNIKIGDLNFSMDMLATPSHVGNNFAPLNDLTTFRAAESFGINEALESFPPRLAHYICEGKVISSDGTILDEAKLRPNQQIDLLSDISIDAPTSCIQALASSPRYKQLLFVDNFQLPPFGPESKFISTQGIEIINRILLTPDSSDVEISDIRLSYRLDN
ncbi:hypothetical protein KUC3_07630 [Alteromonas sp. KC3]|uniref:hypothetical protein n=1 Tax=unclassified Alteromonas TaxID=2614992 RepID=UPI001920FF63|nr:MULTISPECIES: hypothetical protein [unclassified Alteromonas]BCO17906.1 hypothetical protein KUC3_07630 [Alteromonas sp. KC3]BCO21867.1 hypothetical protein KUC14_07360 [Alteromonas sp. KC14]